MVVVVVVGGSVVVVVVGGGAVVVVATTWRTGASAMTTAGPVPCGVRRVTDAVMRATPGAADPRAAAVRRTVADAADPFWSNRSGTMSTAPQRSRPTPCRLPRGRSVLRTPLSS